MASSAAGIEKALSLLRMLPRVSMSNIKDLPSKRIKKIPRRSRQVANTHGRGNKGQGQHMTLPKLGFDGSSSPFYLKIPKEPYYQGHHLRREYPQLSLLQLQRMIDLGRLNTDLPIDLTSLCNSQLISVDVKYKHYGIELTDEGGDIFSSKINIEVQRADEQVVAAIEKNGGTITTRYYDPGSLIALSDPKKFFKRGVPIPKCKLPKIDIVSYYTDPKRRGYLADPEEIKAARYELAQKYGYVLPDIENDPLRDMLLMKKSPQQVFYGLQAGWVVDMFRKVVLKPKDEQLKEFYQ